jgi:hypothetical protein
MVYRQSQLKRLRTAGLTIEATGVGDEAKRMFQIILDEFTAASNSRYDDDTTFL